MVKNLNEKDVALCLYALEDIERENRKQDVLLRDRVMTRADINNYLKKTKRREENLRAAIARPTTWPNHITFISSHPQLETPPRSRGHHGGGQGLSPSQPELATPSWTTTPSWNVSSSPSKVLTPKSPLSQRTSFSSVHVANSDVAKMGEEDSMKIEYRQVGPLDEDELMEDLDSCQDDEVSACDMAKICAGLAASDNFGAMVRQTVAPKPPAAFERANPLYFTLLSKSAPAIYQQDQLEVPAAKTQACQSDSATFVELDHGTFATFQLGRLPTETGQESLVSTEPSVLFLRECLSACIVQGQGFREPANVLMHGAVQVFKGMISRRDPYCLTTLNLLTAVLESVGQRLLAETVLRRILETVHGHLENEDPVNVTIRFMLDIVSGRAKKSEYDANRMWQVYHEICELWGEDSPSALAGLYHVAWSLALDKATRAEAWNILKPLKAKCELTLDPCHFQTITIMTTSARVLYHLGEHWEAAFMINQAIRRLDRMYEDFHPFRLEARSRQAMLLMQLDGSYDVETILQDVLRQQTAILGFENPRTQFTLATLQKFLSRKGRSQELESVILPEILEKSQQQ
jgi:hypothetical protein